VAVYLSESGSFKPAAGFLILSGLLLAIFVAAIILGGSLLTRQAHRNMLDAQQKTSFVAGVSHELKTPLTSICLYAELLSEGRIKDTDKKERYLQVIVDEGRRLTRLVNNLLDFSRLEQGRMKYSIEELNLTEHLTEFIEANRLRIQEAGLKIDYMIPEEAVLVEVDRDAIDQALLNLVDNVIKYAFEGGELRVEVEQVKTSVEIRILDRGPGVPKAHREAIFEKFHRVDDSLTSRGPGSGLGLSIARRIMRDLKGDLLYKERDHGGSCFILVIPIHGGADNKPDGRSFYGHKSVI
jgi:signal transduction histidine kinase